MYQIKYKKERLEPDSHQYSLENNYPSNKHDSESEKKYSGIVALTVKHYPDCNLH